MYRSIFSQGLISMRDNADQRRDNLSRSISIIDLVWDQPMVTSIAEINIYQKEQSLQSITPFNRSISVIVLCVNIMDGRIDLCIHFRNPFLYLSLYWYLRLISQINRSIYDMIQKSIFEIDTEIDLWDLSSISVLISGIDFWEIVLWKISFSYLYKGQYKDWSLTLIHGLMDWYSGQRLIYALM